MFAEKVLANKATAAVTAAQAQFEKRCEACDKTYYSEGAFVNHLGSQKHRMLEARRKTRGGHETESTSDSTFELGEAMESASTTTGGTATVDRAGNETTSGPLDGVVHGLSRASLEETPRELENTVKSEEVAHKANLQQCLFCNYISPTRDLNVHHMGRQHGLFIPEREYLVDLDGLINYLSETIHVLHQCTFCHKVVHTSSGVQTHMRDRGHCMIAYSTEEEQMDVGEHYDFRSTYSDESDEGEMDGDKDGGVSLNASNLSSRNPRNSRVKSNADDEDEWESDSTLSSVPTDEITSVPIQQKDRRYARLGLHRHHSHHDPRSHKNPDGFHSHAHHTPTAVYHDEYELHLPTGRTAGHRSLKTYYRQNLRAYPTPAERAHRFTIALHEDSHEEDADAEEKATETRGRSTQVVSRANGGLGMISASDALKREARTAEKRDRRNAEKAAGRYRAGNEKRANFQKHFRDPLLQ